jgi:Type VI secretion system/phage-baseplate injector OB domain
MAGLHFGKYAGHVIDNRDSDGEGKILVSVPNIYPENESITARPAVPPGFYFVPENGDKVWVEFEGGDTGKPIWSAVDYPAGQWAGEATRSSRRYVF